MGYSDWFSDCSLIIFLAIDIVVTIASLFIIDNNEYCRLKNRFSEPKYLYIGTVDR